MLEDLSAHVLDIAQNSIAAGASRIDVVLRSSGDSKLVEFEIADDGKGMDEARVAEVLNPFCTSRTTRRVGMGLPFLKQSAENCGGRFCLSSEPGVGTKVFASFALDNIDTPPLGDLPGTLLLLLIDAPGVQWTFSLELEGNRFELDSGELSEALGGLESLKIPDVALAFKELVANGLSRKNE